MIYKTSDGTELKGQFQLDGIKYPSNWLDLSSKEERSSLGIYEFPDIETIIEPVIPIPQSQEELFLIIKLSLQQIINVKAQSFGFSDGNSLMLYASIPNDFQALAIQFLTWEASVWSQAGAYKAEVMLGTKPMITPEEAINLMPVFPILENN